MEHIRITIMAKHTAISYQKLRLYYPQHLSAFSLQELIAIDQHLLQLQENIQILRNEIENKLDAKQDEGKGN